MCGKQCEWLSLNSNDWKKKIKNFLKVETLNEVFALGVSFKGNHEFPDGNPFIGGSVEKNENVNTGGLRELREEVGLGVRENC